MGKLAVVAVGGNSLIKDKAHQDVRSQYIAAHETSEHIAAMVGDGWNVVVGHGNGPQVGFILRRSELAAHELHRIPLDVAGADTQGALGYALGQNLQNELRRRGIDRPVAAIVTQTEVDRNDPAFASPSKPVASPRPLRIVELDAIKTLVDAGVIVIGAGGGGIPVVADERGNLEGIEAVIDKDLASSLLARQLGAELFLITTAVEKVALRFGTPEEEWLDHMKLSEARAYLADGHHFARGSMAPKIQAVIEYLEAGGGAAIITDPANLERALRGETGTLITPD
jgi:carbamate kinase